MSVVSLPQDLQTQKLNSLDGDLRDIAEQLIADKFDIKEEVVPEREPSFPGGPADIQLECHCGNFAKLCIIHERTQAAARKTVPGCSNSFCATCYGGIDQCEGMERNSVQTRRDFQTLRNISYTKVASPNTSSIRDSLRNLDMENIPLKGRTLYAPSRWLKYLLRDTRSEVFMHMGYDRAREGSEQVVARLYGCDIVAAPEGTEPHIQVRW